VAPVKQAYLGADSWPSTYYWILGAAGGEVVDLRSSGGDSYTVARGGSSVFNGSAFPLAVRSAAIDGAVIVCVDTGAGQEWSFVDAGTTAADVYFDDAPFGDITDDFTVVCLAGDASQVVVSDGTDLWGLPVTGGATAWSCSAGTRWLAASPSADRWLGLSPRDMPTQDATMTLTLLDDTGTALDSVTFTHPVHATWSGWSDPMFGPDNIRDSSVQWLPLGGNRVAMVARVNGGSPDYEVSVLIRVVDCTGDELAWESAAVTFATTVTDGSLDRLHPFASDFGGQLAIGYRLESFS
jgi:hypothetical protein